MIDYILFFDYNYEIRTILNYFSMAHLWVDSSLAFFVYNFKGAVIARLF